MADSTHDTDSGQATVLHVTFGHPSRWQRIKYWLPSKHWRNDGWRWRVATLAEKLPNQCWTELVHWALRNHEDDPDTPMRDLLRRIPIRTIDSGCTSDLGNCGACYCGKVRTAEADVRMRAAGGSKGIVL